MSQMLRPIIFLDFDDVLCLNAPYGGYDAKLALVRAPRSGDSIDDTTELWNRLFDSNAKQNLQAIDEEFSPRYVLSTSWTWLFEKDELIEIMRLSGLNFVATNLHETWSTPKRERSGVRADEVRGWLNLYHDCANVWVVLDDKLSGTGFQSWGHKALANVVLCQVEVGFQSLEFEQLKKSLTHSIGVFKDRAFPL